MEKTKFDISCENFDLYFAKQVLQLTINQKAELPKDLLFSLFKQGGDLKANALERVDFVAKAYILWKALKKRFFIVFEDERNGVTAGEYIELKKSLKKQDFSLPQSSGFIANGGFVLSGSELTDSFTYLNQLSTSRSYNYLSKVKNLNPNRVEEWKLSMNYVAKFISNYESRKKNLIVTGGLNMPEWLVLLYLYDGETVQSSPIHKVFYRSSYHSSQRKIKQAFGTLQHKGYITKVGFTKGTKIQITALGKSCVDELMAKFVLNI